MEAVGLQNRLDVVPPLAAKVAAKSSRGSSGRARLEALTCAARWFVAAGRIGQATELLERISRHEHVLPETLRIRLHLLRGDLAHLSGDLVTYAECSKAAQAICQTIGDARALSEAFIELGCAAQELGLLEDAATSFERAIEAKTRTGIVQGRAVAEGNLAFTLCLQGRLREARAAIERALASSGAPGSRGRTVCEFFSCYIACRQGDSATAMRAAQAALDGSRNWSTVHAQASALMARILTSLGQDDRALAHARRASRLIDTSNVQKDGETLVQLILVECLLRTGDLKRARATLARARTSVLERARVIRNPEWRQAFLTRLPENAAILRLAERHLPAVSSSSRSAKGPGRGRDASRYRPSNLRQSRSRT
jgi:tetratricopeptide (TPR) repeat protein